ncbi:MAG: thioredoxin domain-containing protein [Candidatus Peregrinibacteria bacterium]
MRRASLLAFAVLLSTVFSACTPSEPLVSARPPRGNANGIIRVVEYTDLQCPACQVVHKGVVLPILQKYGSVIRLDFKHFPLRSVHRFALDAAEASECAADQGKFWEFVDLSFEQQSRLSYDALLSWAGILKLDVSTFESCWKSRSKRDLVLADEDEGQKLGVEGTPTFFVNGQQVEAGFDTLSAAIEAAVKTMQQKL